MSSNYETLYGVGFLDDLHNYFPALLYDSSSFGSVQSVLGYIQSQARNRFDLFSYGQREYLSTHHPPAPSRQLFRTSVNSVPSTQTTNVSTLPRGPIHPILPRMNTIVIDESHLTIPPVQQAIGRPTTNPPVEAETEEEEEDTVQQTATDTFVARALLNLLNIPDTALTRNYGLGTPISLFANLGTRNMDSFLQPVIVRATPEQIAANTTLGNLVSDTEHACAICQDNLTSEQDGRKLNACGHWFHKNCIDTWLERDVHCPVCRHDIREPIRQNTPVPTEEQ